MAWRSDTTVPRVPLRPDAPAHAAQPVLPAQAVPLPAVAALLMSRLRPRALPWALWRLARRGAPLRGTPGLVFGQVLGSGFRGGFGVRPGLDCQGVFAMFDSLADAEAFVESSPLAQAYRERAEESFSVTLLATSSRGSWAGQGMGVGATAVPGVPVAALTRAAIRPARALRFWRHTPQSQDELQRAPGCRLAVGLGEAPLLRQATFSLWDDTDAMLAYSQHGAHQRAARASWGEGHFSEWMFTRFAPVSVRGSWNGRALSVAPRG